MKDNQINNEENLIENENYRNKKNDSEYDYLNNQMVIKSNILCLSL